jgi:hypothetical protein
MLLFLAGCVGLGLWAPPKNKLAYGVAGLTMLLIVFFLIKPDHL